MNRSTRIFTTILLLSMVALLPRVAHANVDSFFDIFYEVSFDPASGGPIVVARGVIPRWTGENRPLIDTSKPATTGVATETGKFYFVASSGRKSVWTFVRQLRGPHFRTWAWCKRRSRSAVTAAVSLRSLPQSSTGRLDVRSVDARS